MGLCDVADFCSDGVDWYLDQIEDIYGASIPSKVVLYKIWIFMEIIHNDDNATVK